MAERTPLTPRERERVRRNRAIGLSIAATILFLDQLTKWAVTHVFQLQLRREVDLLPFFTLRWVENRGVSMGLLPAGSETTRWLLVALTAGIATFVAAWMWREKRRDDAFALSLVLGGALGNIIDRIRFGYVVDFADLHFGEFRPFLIFNVGDAAISIAVVVLLLRAFLVRKDGAEDADPEEKIEHA